MQISVTFTATDAEINFLLAGLSESFNSPRGAAGKAAQAVTGTLVTEDEVDDILPLLTMKKKAALAAAPAPEVKKGRGRPKKEAVALVEEEEAEAEEEEEAEAEEEEEAEAEVEEEEDEAPAPRKGATKGRALDVDKDIMPAFKAYDTKYGRPAAAAILAPYGVMSVRQIPPQHFEDVILKLSSPPAPAKKKKGA